MGPHCIIEVSNVIRWNFVPNGHGRHMHKEDKDKVSASASASHMGYACRHTHNRNTLTHTHTHSHTLTHTHALKQRRLLDPRDKCFCAKLYAFSNGVSQCIVARRKRPLRCETVGMQISKQAYIQRLPEQPSHYSARAHVEATHTFNRSRQPVTVTAHIALYRSR